MALLDDLFKFNIGTGLLIGIGAAVLAPILVPVAATIAKPLAKAAIKGGLIILEKGRETMAEMGEVAEDLIAEAKAEIAQVKEDAVNVQEASMEKEVKA